MTKNVLNAAVATETLVKTRPLVLALFTGSAQPQLIDTNMPCA